MKTNAFKLIAVASALLPAFFHAKAFVRYSLSGGAGVNFYRYAYRYLADSILLEETFDTRIDSEFHRFNSTSLNITLRNLNAFEGSNDQFGWGGGLFTTFFPKNSTPFGISIFRNDDFYSTGGVGYRSLVQGYSAFLRVRFPRLPVFYFTWQDDYHKQVPYEGGVNRRYRMRRFNSTISFSGGQQRSDVNVNYTINNDYISHAHVSYLTFALYNTMNPLDNLRIFNRFNVTKNRFGDGNLTQRRNINFTNVTSYSFSPTKRLEVTFTTGRSRSDGAQENSDNLNAVFFWSPRSGYTFTGGASASSSRFSNGITGGLLLATVNGSIIASPRVWRIILPLGYSVNIGGTKPEGGKGGFYLGQTASAGVQGRLPWSLSHRLGITLGNALDTTDRSLRKYRTNLYYEVFSGEFLGQVRLYSRFTYDYFTFKTSAQKSVSHNALLELQGYYHYNHLVSSSLTTGFRRSSQVTGAFYSVFLRSDINVNPMSRLNAGAFISSSWAIDHVVKGRNTTGFGFNLSWGIGKFVLNCNAQFDLVDGEGNRYSIFITIRRSFAVERMVI